MPIVSAHGEALERLTSRIAMSDAPSGSLFHEIAAALPRLTTLRLAGKTRHLDACCRSSAWVDAALALLAHELPGWSVRRIVRDDDLWFCSLSRSPNLPIELDDTVEASHESMPLAMLLAFIRAKRRASHAERVVGSALSAAAPGACRMCCDNFA